MNSEQTISGKGHSQSKRKLKIKTLFFHLSITGHNIKKKRHVNYLKRQGKIQKNRHAHFIIAMMNRVQSISNNQIDIIIDLLFL